MISKNHDLHGRKSLLIKVVLLDIDNTLLSFSGYVKEAMRDGFSRFGLKPYTDEMFPIFEKINNSLWRQLEQGALTFEELLECRWNRIFKALEIDFDGKKFEEYFRRELFYSAVPEEGANDLLDYLKSKYILCVASNGPYEQQMNRLHGPAPGAGARTIRPKTVVQALGAIHGDADKEMVFIQEVSPFGVQTEPICLDCPMNRQAVTVSLMDCCDKVPEKRKPDLRCTTVGLLSVRRCLRIPS